MVDLRPSLEPALRAFAPSELAQVLVPGGGASVPTRAFWLPLTTEPVPSGGELRRSEPRRVIVVPKSTIPKLPRGTIISIPEYEGAVASDFKVDSLEHSGHDEHRAVVVPYEAAT